MVFNVGKIRSTIQQLGQKLTPDKIQQFGTKVRDMAFQIGRKVSNTLGKVSDIGNKLLPMAETVGTALGYGPEVLGFETARKGLDMVNNAKQNVDTLRNQGLAFTKGGIPPAQIKPKYDYSNVYNLTSLFKGIFFPSFYYIIIK
jgi:hypothetical protein